MPPQDTAVHIPTDASLFPASPQFGFYQAATLMSIKAQAAIANKQAAEGFQGACADWKAANLRNRDLGLALSPKPLPAKTIIIESTYVKNGDLYVWQVFGAPVGECPDLPPAATTTVSPVMPDGTIAVNPVDGSRWQWQSHLTPFGTAQFWVRL